MLRGSVLSVNFESNLAGVYHRVFRRPNGSYVAQLSMNVAAGWEFICSVNGSKVKWL